MPPEFDHWMSVQEVVRCWVLQHPDVVPPDWLLQEFTRAADAYHAAVRPAYNPPAVAYEAALEVRAGTPVSLDVPSLLDQ
jgi:hypothetical protein